MNDKIPFYVLSVLRCAAEYPAYPALTFLANPVLILSRMMNQCMLTCLLTTFSRPTQRCIHILNRIHFLHCALSIQTCLTSAQSFYSPSFCNSNSSESWSGIKLSGRCHLRPEMRRKDWTMTNEMHASVLPNRPTSPAV